jgi:protein TonB
MQPVKHSTSAEPSAVLFGELIAQESAIVSKFIARQARSKPTEPNKPVMEMLQSKQGALESSLSAPVAQPAAAPISLPTSSHPLLNNPKPPYPISSRENGEQGRVWLRLCVSAQGMVSQLQLARSSGHPALDRSALNTVTHWKFLPAMQNGSPISYCYRLPIEFVLT